MIVVLKLSLAGCQPPSPLAAFRTPSGHTASATLIYGGLIAVISGDVGVTVLASVICAILIGVSRLILHLHTLAEAMVGGSVGALGSSLLAVALPHLTGQARSPRYLTTGLPVIALVMALALHGVHWRLEPKISYVSHHYWPWHVCRMPSAQ